MDLSGVGTDFSKQLNDVHSAPINNKPAAYSALLDTIYSTSPSDHLAGNLTAYVVSLLGVEIEIGGVTPAKEPVNITAARQLLADFTIRLAKQSSPELKISVATKCLQILNTRVLSFEEQDTSLKLLLADAHSANEDYVGSAKALQSVTLDSTQGKTTDKQRAEIWVRIARCYLEEDDATSASTYINRAKNIMHNVEDKGTTLNFRLSQARIYDAQRQFLDASASYHSISFDPLVDEDDLQRTLSAAIRCAVLAPAGPQRSRMLARLYKDERMAQTEEFSILEKIFLDRVLSKEEVANFAANLLPHQLAKTSDGTTVLDKAVLEHNLLGASKLYLNIGTDNLGTLLGVDGETAEQYAAQMIEQGRLSGHIDQIEGMIFFEGEGAGETLKGQGHERYGVELRKWDAQVQGVAEEVEKLASMVQEQFPDLYVAHILQ